MEYRYLDPYQLSSFEELKKAYRNLCMRYHPDICRVCSKAEAEEIMKRINAEYASASEVLQRRAQAGGSVKDEGETSETLKAFADIINQIIGLDGLTVELIGCWIWVSGSTYKHKAALLKSGFKWSGKRKMWYWHSPNERHHFSKKKVSTDSMRAYYGSQVLTNSKNGMVRA